MPCPQRAEGACASIAVVDAAMTVSLDGTLPYDEVAAGEDLLDAIGERRFDIVVDPVGGRLRTDSLRVAAPLGRMLLVGNAGGDWQHSVPTNELWRGKLVLLGFAVGFYLPKHPEKARLAAEAALQAISQGLVDIPVETLPLAEVTRVERGGVGGRVLTM